jgi:hypothetical protein
VHGAAIWLRRIATAGGRPHGVVLCTAPFAGTSAPGDGRVRVTVLAWGRAMPVLVQTPGRQSLLVDTGGSSGGFDIGGRVIATRGLGAWRAAAEPGLR